MNTYRVKIAYSIYIVLIAFIILLKLLSPDNWNNYSDKWKRWIALSDHYGLMQIYGADGVWTLRSYSGYNYFDVESYDFNDKYVFGKASEGNWFVFDISKTNNETLISFESEGEFEAYILNLGMDIEYKPKYPNDVEVTMRDRDVLPWNYEEMRGFLGITDITWGVVFSMFAWAVNFYAGFYSIDKTELYLLKIFCWLYLLIIFYVFWLFAFDPAGGAIVLLLITSCISMLFLRLKKPIHFRNSQ